KLYEKNFVLRREKFGALHRETLRSQLLLAGAMLAHGRGAEAMALARQTAERWEQRQETDADSLYDASCARALAAAALRALDSSPEGAKQADTEADLAMAVLKRAVSAGWWDYRHMANDPDLKALRDREDFKELMSELKAGQTERGRTKPTF